MTNKDIGNMLKISRKNIWKKNRAFLYVTDNINMHINPDGNSDGDGERESSDTEDVGDCSSSEDMDL